MKVKDLPQPIKDLAIIRAKQEDDEFNIESHTPLTGMFLFFETPEDGDFWHEINKGRFQVFYDKYTYGFKEGDKVEFKDKVISGIYIIEKIKISNHDDNSVKIFITIREKDSIHSTATLAANTFYRYKPYLIKNKNQTNEQNKEHSGHESEGDLSNGTPGHRRESGGIQFRERKVENTIKHSQYKERSCLREISFSKITN